MFIWIHIKTYCCNSVFSSDAKKRCGYNMLKSDMPPQATEWSEEYNIQLMVYGFCHFYSVHICGSSFSNWFILWDEGNPFVPEPPRGRLCNKQLKTLTNVMYYPAKLFKAGLQGFVLLLRSPRVTYCSTMYYGNDDFTLYEYRKYPPWNLK